MPILLQLGLLFYFILQNSTSSAYTLLGTQDPVSQLADRITYGCHMLMVISATWKIFLLHHPPQIKNTTKQHNMHI